MSDSVEDPKKRNPAPDAPEVKEQPPAAQEVYNPATTSEADTRRRDLSDRSGSVSLTREEYRSMLEGFGFHLDPDREERAGGNREGGHKKEGDKGRRGRQAARGGAAGEEGARGEGSGERAAGALRRLFDSAQAGPRRVDGQEHVQAGRGENVLALADSSVTARDATVSLRDRAGAVVTGESQVFAHDNSHARVRGPEVTAFANKHGTVESEGSNVWATDGALIRARGGEVHATGNSVVYATDATVQAAGNSIVVADGRTQVEASGNAVVLITSPEARVNLRSPDAKVIFMNDEARRAQITRDPRAPAGSQQVVEVDSPLALEKTMELGLREIVHREPGRAHYPDGGGNGQVREARAPGGQPSADEEATRIARRLAGAQRAEEALAAFHDLRAAALADPRGQAARYWAHLTQAGGGSSRVELALMNGNLGELQERRQELGRAVESDSRIQATDAAREFASATSPREATRALLHLARLARENPQAMDYLRQLTADRAPGFQRALRQADSEGSPYLPQEVTRAQSGLRPRLEADSSAQAAELARSFAQARTPAEAARSLGELIASSRVNPHAREHVESIAGTQDPTGLQEKLQHAITDGASALPREATEAQQRLRDTSLKDPAERAADLARQLIAAGSPEAALKALRALEDAAGRDPRGVAARYLNFVNGDDRGSGQLEVSLLNGEFDQRIRDAQGRLRSYMETPPGERATNDARELVRARNPEEAGQALDRLREEARTNPLAAAYLGRLGNTAEVEQLRRTLAAESREAPAAGGSALTEAQRKLRASVERDSREQATDAARAFTGAREGPEAARALNHLIKLSERNPQAARLVEQLGRPDDLLRLQESLGQEGAPASNTAARARALKESQDRLKPAIERSSRELAVDSAWDFARAASPQDGARALDHLVETARSNPQASRYLQQLGNEGQVRRLREQLEHGDARALAGAQEKIERHIESKDEVKYDPATGRISEITLAGDHGTLRWDSQRSAWMHYDRNGRPSKQGPVDDFDPQVVRRNLDGSVRGDFTRLASGAIRYDNREGATELHRRDGSRETRDLNGYAREQFDRSGRSLGRQYWDGQDWRSAVRDTDGREMVHTDGNGVTRATLSGPDGKKIETVRDARRNTFEVTAGGATYLADWNRHKLSYRDAQGRQTNWYEDGSGRWRQAARDARGRELVSTDRRTGRITVQFKPESRQDERQMQQGRSACAAEIDPRTGTIVSRFSNGIETSGSGWGQVEEARAANGRHTRFEGERITLPDGRVLAPAAPSPGSAALAHRAPEAGETPAPAGVRGRDAAADQRPGQPPGWQGGPQAGGDSWTISDPATGKSTRVEGRVERAADGTVTVSRADGTVEQVEANGRSTVTRNGRLTQVTEANGSRWSVEPDPRDRGQFRYTLHRKDARGGDVQETFAGTHALNADGSITIRTRENGAAATIRRNVDGSTSRLNARGLERERVYDSGFKQKFDGRGRLTESVDAGGNITRFRWAAGARPEDQPDRVTRQKAGQSKEAVIAERGPNPANRNGPPVLRQVVDEQADAGRQAAGRYGGIAEFHRDGSQITYQVDRAGKVSDALLEHRDGSRQTYRANERGELVEVKRELPNGSFIERNPDGLITRTRDSQGVETRFVWDAGARPADQPPPTPREVWAKGKEGPERLSDVRVTEPDPDRPGQQRTVLRQVLAVHPDGTRAMGGISSYLPDGSSLKEIVHPHTGEVAGGIGRRLDGTQLNYDARGRLLSTTGLDEGPLSVTADGALRQRSGDGETLSRLDGSRLTYDARGNLTESRHANGNVMRYRWDENNRLTGYNYGAGWWTRSDATGNDWAKEGEPSNRWSGTVEVDKRTGVLAESSAGGNWNRTMNPDGSATIRNRAGDLTEIWDTNWNKTRIEYDGRTPVRITYPDNSVARKMSDSWDVRDSRGVVTVKPGIAVDQATGAITERGYSDTVVREANGTRTTLDEQRRPREVQRADGSRTTYLRDAATGEITGRTERNADGSVAHLDARGNITRVDLPHGQRRRFDRDARGNVIAVAESNGNTWTSQDGGLTFRNQAGETRSGQPQIERNGSYRFAAEASREITRNADNSTTYSDRHGRLTERPDGSQVLANSRGAVIATRDAAGRVTEFEPRDRGPGDEPTRVKLPNGRVWERLDAGLWRDAQSGDTMRGSWSLDRNGDLTLRGPEGNRESITFRLDGSTVTRNDRGLVARIQDKFGGLTQFEYDAQNNLVSMATPDGARWSRLNGDVWVKDGTTETWRGSRSVDPDGTVRMSTGNLEITRSPDGWERHQNTRSGAVTYERRNANGSEVTKNEAGQVTAIRNARGETYRFGYNSETGQLERVTFPSGQIRTTAAGGVRFAPDENGNVHEISADSRGEKVYRGDGSFIRGENGQVVERRDGALIEHRDTRQTERIQPDGTHVFTDERGRVTRVEGRAGTFEYGYDEQSGRVNSYTVNGLRYTTRDNVNWTAGERHFTARIDVLQDGTRKQTNPATGVETFYRNDGTAVVRENGTLRVYDGHDTSAARITETIDRSGSRMRYEYGTVTRTVDGKDIRVDNQLLGFRSGDGPWMRTTDGINYRSADGRQTFRGVAILHADGALQRIDTWGNQTIVRLDGSRRQGDNQRRQDLEQAARNMVRSMEWNLFGDSRHDRSRVVEREMGQRSAAENQIIREMFNRQWQADGSRENMEQVIRNRIKNDDIIDKALNHLRRADDANFHGVRPDFAGRIHTALIDHDSWRGERSKEQCEQAIRTALSQLNSQQIAQLQAEYRNTFGSDLAADLHARFTDTNSFTRQSIDVYLQGKERVTDQQMANLMVTAANGGNVGHFEEAAGLASPAARNAFVDAQGGWNQAMDRVWGRFGHWYGARDALHVMESTRFGQITEAQRLRDSTGWLSNDEKTIDKVLREMPEQRRAMFFRGEFLSQHPNEVRTKEDREALAMYGNLTHAIDNAYSWAHDLRVAQLRDQVRVEGGGLARDVGRHGGSIYADSLQEIMGTVQNMNQRQWQALVDDPEYRQRMERELRPYLGDDKYAAVRQLVDAKLELKGRLDGMTTREQLRTQNHFARMTDGQLDQYLHGRQVSNRLGTDPMNAGRRVDMFGRLEAQRALEARAAGGDGDARRDLEALRFYRSETYQAVRDGARRNIVSALDDAGSDRRAGLEALTKMTPDERQRYRTDERFRNELKQKVESVFGRGTRARETAMNILNQVESSRTNDPSRLDVVDRLNILSYDGQAGHRRSAVISEVSRALQEDPALKDRLQNDREYARRFQTAVRAAAPGMAYENLVRPLVEQGRLTGEQLARAGALSRQELNRVLLNMSPEHLRAINESQREREALLSSRNGEDRKVVENILRQGAELAGRQRELISSLPADQREAVARILAQRGPSSAADRAAVDRLDRGTREKLEALTGDLRRGPATAADQVRLFVLGGGATAEQVRQTLSAMSLEQRRLMVGEYGRKYGMRDVKRDLIESADASERPQMEYLLRTEHLQAGTRFAIAQDQAHASDGWSSSLMRYTHYGGSLTDMHQNLADIHREIAAASGRGQRVDDRVIDRLEQSFRESLVNFREAKEQFADSIVNTAVTATALAAAPFTGGASLYPILYGMAAGAAIKVGTHMLISGADFEMTARNVSRRMASGMVEGGFAMVNPGQLGALMGVGGRAAGAASNAVAAEFKTLAGNAAGRALSSEGQALLESEMRSMVGSALANCARATTRQGATQVAGLSERELARTAARVLQKEGVNLASREGEQMARALTASMSQRLTQAIASETSTYLRMAQQEFLHAGANAGIGGTAAFMGTFTDGLLTRAMSQEGLSMEGVLEAGRESFRAAGEGAFGGAAMSGFGRAMHAGGHLAGIEHRGGAARYAFGVLQAVGSGAGGETATQITFHGAIDGSQLASTTFNMAIGSASHIHQYQVFSFRPRELTAGGQHPAAAERETARRRATTGDTSAATANRDTTARPRADGPHDKPGPHPAEARRPAEPAAAGSTRRQAEQLDLDYYRPGSISKTGSPAGTPSGDVYHDVGMYRGRDSIEGLRGILETGELRGDTQKGAQVSQNAGPTNWHESEITIRIGATPDQLNVGTDTNSPRNFNWFMTGARATPIEVAGKPLEILVNGRSPQEISARMERVRKAVDEANAARTARDLTPLDVRVTSISDFLVRERFPELASHLPEADRQPFLEGMRRSPLEFQKAVGEIASRMTPQEFAQALTQRWPDALQWAAGKSGERGGLRGANAAGRMEQHIYVDPHTGGERSYGELVQIASELARDHAQVLEYESRTGRRHEGTSGLTALNNLMDQIETLEWARTPPAPPAQQRETARQPATAARVVDSLSRDLVQAESVPSDRVYRPRAEVPSAAELAELNGRVPSMNREAAKDWSRRMAGMRERWQDTQVPRPQGLPAYTPQQAHERVGQLRQAIREQQVRYDAELARLSGQGQSRAQIEQLMRADGHPLRELHDRRQQLVREFADLNRWVNDVAGERRRQLQAEYDAFAGQQGLPRLRVVTAEHMHAAGGYIFGEGVIRIPKEDLLAAGGGQGLTRATFHEGIHGFVHDREIIQLAINEATRPGGTVDPAAVQQRYAQLTNTDPDHPGSRLTRDQLDRVLQLTGGARPELTEAQKQRAREIAASVANSHPVAGESRELGNTARLIDRHLLDLEANTDGRAVDRLFERLSDTGARVLEERLFGQAMPDALAEQYLAWEAVREGADPAAVGYDRAAARRLLAGDGTAEHPGILRQRLNEVNARHEALVSEYLGRRIEKEAHGLAYQTSEPGETAPGRVRAAESAARGPSPEAARPASPGTERTGAPPPDTAAPQAVPQPRPLTERVAERRELIAALERAATRTAEQERMFANLQRQHADDVKQLVRAEREVIRRMDELEAARERGGLSERDAREYAGLEQELTGLTRQIQAEQRAAVERLVNQGRQQLSSGGASGQLIRGGDATQNLIFNVMNQELDRPIQRLGNRSLRASGFELVPLRAGSSIDAIGGDFALVNRRTGEYLLLDASQRTKSGLPELRQNNVITSDPYDPRFGGDPDRKEPADLARRRADVLDQFRGILDRFQRQGSPLNVLDTPVPIDDSRGGHMANRGRAERLAAIDRLARPEQREAELISWRQDTLDRIAALERYTQDMLDLAHQLRRTGRAERARQLEDLAVHSRRHALHESKKFLLNDLLPRENRARTAQRKEPLSREAAMLREGQSGPPGAPASGSRSPGREGEQLRLSGQDQLARPAAAGRGFASETREPGTVTAGGRRIRELAEAMDRAEARERRAWRAATREAAARDRQAAEQALHQEVLSQARELSRRMGLPEGLVDHGTIVVGRPDNAAGSYDSRSHRLVLDPHDADPRATLFHELRHLSKFIKKSALAEAAPATFERLIRQSVLDGVGGGGTRVQSDFQAHGRAALGPEGRAAARGALAELLGLPHPDPAAYLARLKGNDAGRYRQLVEAFGGGSRGQQRAAAELAGELSHYEAVRSMATIGAEARQLQTIEPGDTPAAAASKEEHNARARALNDEIHRQRLLYEGSKRLWGDGLEAHPEMLRETRGFASAVTGLVDPAHYQRSTEEFSPRRYSNAESLREWVRQMSYHLELGQGLRELRDLARGTQPGQDTAVQNLLQRATENLERWRSARGDTERVMALDQARAAANQLLERLSPQAANSGTIVNDLVRTGLLERQAVPDSLKHLLVPERGFIARGIERVSNWWTGSGERSWLSREAKRRGSPVDDFIAARAAERALHPEQPRPVEDYLQGLPADFRAPVAEAFRQLEAHEPGTAAHTRRVTEMALLIGREMGLPAEQLDLLAVAGILHDLGKLTISRELLLNTDQLTPEERSIIQWHAVSSFVLAERTGVSDARGYRDVALIAAHHHENFGGGGYPTGFAGEQLNLISRILKVADVWDATSSRRAYHAAEGGSDRKEITFSDRLVKQELPPALPAAELTYSPGENRFVDARGRAVPADEIAFRTRTGITLVYREVQRNGRTEGILLGPPDLAALQNGSRRIEDIRGFPMDRAVARVAADTVSFDREKGAFVNQDGAAVPAGAVTVATADRRLLGVQDRDFLSQAGAPGSRLFINPHRTAERLTLEGGQFRAGNEILPPHMVVLRTARGEPVEMVPGDRGSEYRFRRGNETIDPREVVALRAEMDPQVVAAYRRLQAQDVLRIVTADNGAVRPAGFEQFAGTSWSRLMEIAGGAAPTPAEQALLSAPAGTGAGPLRSQAPADPVASRRAAIDSYGRSAADETINRAVDLYHLRDGTRDIFGATYADRSSLGYQVVSRLIMDQARAAGMFSRLGIPEGAVRLDLLVEGNREGAYLNHSNRIEINITGDSPMQIFRHELQHMARAVERTALFNADRAGYRQRVIDSVLANAGNGERRWTYDEATGERVVNRRAKLSAEGRELLRQALGAVLADRSASLELLVAQERFKPLLQERAFGGDARRLVNELNFERHHFETAYERWRIDDTALASNPELARLIADRTAAYRKAAAGRGGSLADHPEMVKLADNVSNDTTGIGDGRAYRRQSREEFAARRAGYTAGLAAIAQAVRQAYADLTPQQRRDLISRTGRPLIAAIRSENLREGAYLARRQMQGRAAQSFYARTVDTIRWLFGLSATTGSAQ